MSKSAVVIIPTTGSKRTIEAIHSVYDQKYKNVTPMVVVDGSQFAEDFKKNVSKKIKIDKDHVTHLPVNTGGGGYYGHRIYAGFSHLVNADYIFFLDQDNWYEKDHVSTMIDTLESKPDLQWVFSLRKIVSEDGEFLCKDDCESLGKWPVAGHQDNFHVDTSTYAFKAEFLSRVASLWHNGYGGDRIFLHMMKRNFPDTTFDTSGKYTLNYRLDGNPNSVKIEFFEQLNAYNKLAYNGNYPWVKK